MLRVGWTWLRSALGQVHSQRPVATALATARLAATVPHSQLPQSLAPRPDYRTSSSTVERLAVSQEACVQLTARAC